jgi:hypothetical protein
MKKIANNFLTIVAAVMLSSTSYAQMANNTDLLDVVDQKQTTNRPAGLDARVTVATDQPVVWSHSQYGYAASYSMGNTNFMATYDNESHYVETYEKIDWNNSAVSSVLKSSFLTSSYKEEVVIGYWKSSDPDEYGYYLEVKDKSGKQSGIWADKKGNFYNKPFFLSESLVSLTNSSNGTN